MPLLVPSAELLSEWAAKFQILHSAIYWQGTPSVIEPPDDMPNPNDLDELDNARFWVPHTGTLAACDCVHTYARARACVELCPRMHA